jgi:hypothetical protein
MGCPHEPLLGISVFFATDTEGLEDNKAARWTSKCSLTKLASLQEITIIIMCV